MLEYKNFITVGKIVKPVGVKGNLKVISLTDFPERFNKLQKVSLYCERDKEFFVNKSDKSFEFNITECKVYDSYVNIKFENYDNVDESKELVNLFVMIDEKKREKLDEGKFYFYELIDSDVYDSGDLIGKVISIVNYGSGDLFNVKFNDKEVLIPFKDEFIKNIDVKNKRIDVELIEGFLD